ncbi:MAG TPA: hypothetical protein VMQ60_07795 [Acidobacteriaceae bacterium]|nr:hypothetical protein [Acidobacteriaceae bacterium]
MLGQLHITSLRPGPANHKDAPPPNFDESKANPYPKLPDPLILNNGKKVTTAKMWWEQRRPQIVEDFDREVYGRVPPHTPKVTWEVAGTSRETAGKFAVITKQLVGHVDNSSYPQISVNIRLSLTTPANASGPVPIILQFSSSAMTPPSGARAAAEPLWKQLVLEKGWGYAVISTTSIQAENGAGLTSGGIIGLVNKGQFRKPDDWGALRAWAWGASRAMDYFETDPSVDAKQVGLEGHSRDGKAALVTMAYDQRFAIAYVSSSGTGGSKLLRRNFGEPLEDLAAEREYHWMAGNFLKYAGPLTANDLPVDAHELIALCAPRPVFIGGGSTVGPGSDNAADAPGSFMAAVAAGPVYKLLGKKDLGATTLPPMETALINGEIGFRQHTGGHTDVPNWPTFLIFASHTLHGPVAH